KGGERSALGPWGMNVSSPTVAARRAAAGAGVLAAGCGEPGLRVESPARVRGGGRAYRHATCYPTAAPALGKRMPRVGIAPYEKETALAIRARDVMQKNVISVTPETSVADVARLFVEEGIHGA